MDNKKLPEHLGVPQLKEIVRKFQTIIDTIAYADEGGIK